MNAGLMTIACDGEWCCVWKMEPCPGLRGIFRMIGHKSLLTSLFQTEGPLRETKIDRPISGRGNRSGPRGAANHPHGLEKTLFSKHDGRLGLPSRTATAVGSHRRSAATNPRTSLQPSSIMEARASRISFSIGYSRLRPLPPKICSAALATSKAVLVAVTFEAMA